MHSPSEDDSRELSNARREVGSRDRLAQFESHRERNKELQRQHAEMNGMMHRLHEKVGKVFQTHLRACIAEEELRRLSQEFPLDFDAVNAAMHQPHGEKGRLFLHAEPSLEAVRRRRGKRSPIYSEHFVVKKIFGADSDYSGYMGPGFEYMALMDRKNVPIHHLMDAEANGHDN